jgi:histidyl-tRNA synthetase
LNARYVLILGEEELEKGRVVLRNMEDKSQEEIPMENILGILKNKILRG